MERCLNAIELFSHISMFKIHVMKIELKYG